MDAELESLPRLNTAEIKKKAADAVYALIVAGISALYLLSSIIRIRPNSEEEWTMITLSGVASMVLGLCINNLMRAQGVHSARQWDPIVAAEEALRALAPVIVRNVYTVEQWCIRKNAENRRQQRAMILAEAGMEYGACFDEKGSPLPPPVMPEGWSRREAKREYRRRLRAYRRAVHLKVARLRAADLIGGSGGRDPYKLGRDLNTYMTQGFYRGIASKVGIAAATSFLSADMVRSFDWANLIMMIGQLGIFLGFGFYAMARAKAYVRGEYRERVEKQAELIRECQRETGIV